MPDLYEAYQYLLIRPYMRNITRPPIGLMYNAAMYPKTYVWDVFAHGDPLPVIWNYNPKVVGVQVLTPQRNEAWRILKEAKKQGCITVAGGPHIAVLRKQVASFDFIDYLVIGDGEYPWSAICRWVAGESQWQPPRVQCSRVEDLDELPVPDYAPFAQYVEKYHQLAAVTLGRGCAGSCIFCSTWWVNGDYRHHSEAWLTEMLGGIQRAGYVDLIWDDDCMTGSPEGVDAIVNAMSKFKWRYVVGTTRVDMLDEQAVIALKKCGFTSLSFGIESGSQTILDKINKKTDLERGLYARALCRKHGIRFIALMMEGFPFETEETRKEDLEFRRKLAPDEWGSVGHIMVLPGTVLYQQLKREGKISDDYWLGEEEYLKLERK